ncbi:MAG: peptidase M42 [Zestosphaera tikiterensis]|uniref:Peptidase M42 n=1 Tax=Zestosphaera tikiterensis TaxID=1973259 RepID=A0A2R7Y863_9CREN|nr:MAG: peptidase M42 [Zestosphaera tikiterensis]
MSREERLTKDEVFTLLKKLSEPVGPSGYEGEVRGIVVDFLKNVADSVWIDTLGNVIAVKKASSSDGKMMFAAHMDEIGLFVSHIDEKGYLRVLPIGGVTERSLIYQRVLVKTRDGRYVRGVVGLKPPHIAKPEEARQVPELKELFVDVGASSRDEVMKLGVRVGDVVVFDRDLVMLSRDRVSGKALDDRVGLTVMLKAFELIEPKEVDVYAIATVQEEVGLKGAKTSAFSISPDVAIALDVTIASDVPGVSEHEWCTQLGKGPAIKIADGRYASGLIANPEVVNMLVKVAEESGIPYQMEVLAGGTTDASEIALNKEGVPAGVISIPSRYIHSPVEVVDLLDVINAVKLSKAFAEKITTSWVKTLKGFKIK